MRNIVKILFIFLLLISSVSYATDFSVDPRSAFLRSEGDNAQMPLIIDLNSLGALPGDSLLLTRLGDFTAYSGSPPITSMPGVFSTSNDILDTSQLNRVTGALDAGNDYISGTTYFGSPTDIAEDFMIDPNVIITIPINALYLFVSAADSLYLDNRDLDNDFAVSVIVNKKPIAKNDTVATNDNTPSGAIVVLSNDSDFENDTLSVIGNTSPSNGSLTKTGNTFVYTPNAGFIGGDSFTYTNSDGYGSDVATVTITVNYAATSIPALNMPMLFILCLLLGLLVWFQPRSRE